MLTGERLDKEAQLVLRRACETALQRRFVLTAEDIMLALFDEPGETLRVACDRLAVDASRIVGRIAKLSAGEDLAFLPPGHSANRLGILPEVYGFLRQANLMALRRGRKRISTEHLLLAIMARQSALARILADAGLTYERLTDALNSLHRLSG